MKKLLTSTALVCALTFSPAAFAASGVAAYSGNAARENAITEWYGKEGQDETPAYMERALAKLPAEKADDFRTAMQGANDENHALAEQLARLHGDLHELLTAPTFDRQAFLAKRAQIRQVRDQIAANRAEAFATAVSGLSQEERVTLTRSLHQEKTRKHHGHHNSKTKHIHGKNASSSTPEKPDTSAIQH